MNRTTLITRLAANNRTRDTDPPRHWFVLRFLGGTRTETVEREFQFPPYRQPGTSTCHFTRFSAPVPSNRLRVTRTVFLACADRRFPVTENSFEPLSSTIDITCLFGRTTIVGRPQQNSRTCFLDRYTKLTAIIILLFDRRLIISS
jgi:hypothetical protein